MNLSLFVFTSKAQTAESIAATFELITFCTKGCSNTLRTICTLSTAQTTAAQLNSEAVLKSIEAQHGLLVERAEIYSFSHLTFQEYFTARNFVANSDPQVLDKN